MCPRHQGRPDREGLALTAPEQRYDAVIFDFGGVLASSPFELIRAGGFAAGHDGDEVLEMMLGPYAEDTDHPWHRVERGEIAARRSTAAGWSPRRKTRSITLPAHIMWDMKPHTAMVDRATRLRAEGYRTAVLTNNAARGGRPLARARAGRRAVRPGDRLLTVGMRKPNPAIYTYTAEQLGVAPERCVFLDDAAGNIAGAERGRDARDLRRPRHRPALAELDDVLAGNT